MVLISRADMAGPLWACFFNVSPQKGPVLFKAFLITWCQTFTALWLVLNRVGKRVNINPTSWIFSRPLSALYIGPWAGPSISIFKVLVKGEQNCITVLLSVRTITQYSLLHITIYRHGIYHNAIWIRVRGDEGAVKGRWRGNGEVIKRLCDMN